MTINTIKEPVNQPLPCDEVTERALLGVMMWSAMPSAELNFDIIRRVKPDWFYVPAHQAMYAIICERCHAGVLPTMKEVTRIARDTKQEGQVSPALVAQCYTDNVGPAAWAHYADILEACAYRRALRKIAIDVAEIAYDMSNDPAAELDRVSATLAETQASNDDQGSCTARELAAGALEMIMANHKGRPGIKTGMQSLDSIFRLWLPGCVHVIAARPGQGKTAMACRLVEAWTVDQGIPSLFISLEMSRNQLAGRLIAQMAREPLQITLGDLGRETTEGENQSILAAALRLGEAPLWTEDRSAMSYRQVAASIRMHVRRHGVEIVFVDYLQLVRGLPKQDAFARIEETSIALAEVAKSLSITIIALAQLNRESAKRSAKAARPKLEDLRGSGQIEQDAATVIGLHRPSTTVPFDQLDAEDARTWDSEDTYRSYSEAIVLKNRYGQADAIGFLKWTGEQTRFDSWE